MPVRLAQHCPVSRCPEFKPCPYHRPAPRAAFVTAIRTELEGSHSEGYGSDRWRKARATFLSRNPNCVHCGELATTVDHIIPHDGTHATFWDTSNWQPLCMPCHRIKTAAEHQPYRRRMLTRFAMPVTLVCGPPGAGKSSYVHGRSMHGDLILDVDALYQALSGLPMYDKPIGLLPLVVEARDAVINRLCRPASIRHAWLITGGAKHNERQRFLNAGAEIVMLDISPTECLRRITRDPRRAANWQQWQTLIDQWWDAYDHWRDT